MRIVYAVAAALLLAGGAAIAASGVRTITAVTIAASSAQAIASSAGGRMFLSINNESTTATIACAFGATAAINTAGSYTISPGQGRTWTGSRDFPLKGDAINCIASAASTPATFETWP